MLILWGGTGPPQSVRFEDGAEGGVRRRQPALADRRNRSGQGQEHETSVLVNGCDMVWVLAGGFAQLLDQV